MKKLVEITSFVAETRSVEMEFPAYRVMHLDHGAVFYRISDDFTETSITENHDRDEYEIAARKYRRFPEVDDRFTRPDTQENFNAALDRCKAFLARL
jgi:hypothetical protein